MVTAKVSDLEFKRSSAVEILRFSVDELKTELFARTIPFFSCAHKRELQLKLSEALAVVIDPTKLAADAPAVSEIGEASDDTVNQCSAKHGSPSRSVYNHYSKRESYSNLINKQMFELEKLRLEAEIDLNQRKLDCQHALDMAQAQNRPTVHSNVNAPVQSTTNQQRIDNLVKRVPRFDPLD